MVVIRATTKLLGRLGIAPDPAPARSSGVLGDWFATLIQVRRGRVVLAISAVTLLPVIVVGRDLPTLPVRLADGVREMLLDLGVTPGMADRERLMMAQVAIARTNDRSTVGVLTDFQRLLRFDFNDDPSAGLLERSRRLARTPIVARHLFPDHATRAAFGVAHSKGAES
jgi:hypothetical protein